LESGYIEGSWDLRLNVQTGFFIMEVEGEGMIDVDCGGEVRRVIPERARAVTTVIREDPGEGCFMQFVLKMGGIDGGSL
jgi:hypothetical protein